MQNDNIYHHLHDKSFGGGVSSCARTYVRDRRHVLTVLIQDSEHGPQRKASNASAEPTGLFPLSCELRGDICSHTALHGH